MGDVGAEPIQQLRMKAAKPRSVVRFLSPAEEQRLREALTARDIEHAAGRHRGARKRRTLGSAGHLKLDEAREMPLDYFTGSNSRSG